MNANALLLSPTPPPENALSVQALLERWGASDFCESCWKRLLRVVSAVGLSQLPPSCGDGEPRPTNPPVYLALSGRDLLEEGVQFDALARELRERWTGDDAAIWMLPDDGASPRLVAVLRPDERGDPRLIWLGP
jgi:hypothetical protein